MLSGVDPEITIRVADELLMFLPAARREAVRRVAHDGTSTLGHVVESLGVPLPEAGPMTVDGEPADPAARPPAGAEVTVAAVPRPQPVPLEPDQAAPRFLLDVHLGTLARRMRLLGLDTAYHNDMDDPALVVQANEERRVLLTQDRGLLRRRALWFGAYVRGSRPDDQLRDLLDRFAPALSPWTRCTACNGELVPVDKQEVERHLQDGTRRSYDVYGRCADCGQVYWRGAHGDHLEEIVRESTRLVGGAAVTER
ncbi:Mut7-C ubiquitin/RNAse domain-containing protein [Actinomadura madurae]|uniref:Mut7-C ubiquitin/RNAse domain-containing protein n=1 Tax=Actinomadura madurae TaxID=1993 RepID=UPI0020D229B2|nr:Mut7-C ubiquitin/RNAse domain-containing protein [Actinomadura madurae]MCP9950215.1 Mut7-C ubiquitin/RNAse domain-containing protein [Actinomadura madurae]MCP9966986.1 Mut7-C ubiquitin/RNAse domain-containing protein [Actinomadura madurae]